MRFTSLVAAISTVVLVACGGDKAGTTDTATATDSATAATPAPTAPAWTEGEIVGYLDAVNVADSSFGRIASTKGTSADVKAFGVMMMNDHRALRKQGQDLAGRLGATVAPPAADSLPMKTQRLVDSLNAIPRGALFDRSYIENEIANHQTILNFIDQAIGAAQNAELKDFLAKARPNIEAHLKRAQDIQSRLGTTATP